MSTQQTTPHLASSQHHASKRRARAFAVLALALLAILTTLPAPAEAAPQRVFHITVDGTAGANGASRKTAGRLTDLPRFVQLANPGDEIWIRAGVYTTTGPIVINAGGSPESPVVIRGVAPDGSNRKSPTLTGTRTAPYSPTGNHGSDVFRLVSGADNLEFHNMAFVNQGNGAFRVGADISNLTISDVSATNVRRFFESYPSSPARSATINGLTISDVKVDGFSKGAIRLQNNTNDVVIQDVVGDSQRQDGDPFAMGVHFDDTVHDVLLERVTMRNSHDSAGDGYWNGDGFTTEKNTYDLRFVDTVATGNTDAGYDLKSTATTLIRPVAEDNKRNFRFTGQADLVSAVGRDPHRRGGFGSQAQVWAGASARVRVVDGTFTDQQTDTYVFAVEEAAQLTVENTSVIAAPGAKEALIERGARLYRQ